MLSIARRKEFIGLQSSPSRWGNNVFVMIELTLYTIELYLFHIQR